MDVNGIFLLAATILSIGFMANLFFDRTKVPDLVWLMVLGLLIGPLFGVLDRSAFVAATPYLSALALLLILFDAGLNMNIYKLIREVPRGSLLALSGFTLSMLTVSSLSWALLGLSPILALLLGSIVGGVSSAIVIPIVSSLDYFREETALLLDIESVITDPLSILVAFALLDILSISSGSFDSIFIASQSIISSFSISIVIGFFAGTLWLALLTYLREEDYYYMFTLGFLFLIYPLVQLLEGNGAIAIFVIGVVLGNGRRFGKMLKLDYLSSGLTERSKSFQSELTFVIKSFFFVFLGALITIGEVKYFIYGSIFALIIVATKYVAVKLSTLGTGIKTKEKRIMYFMVPRGLAAAVLVTIVRFRGIEGTQHFPPIVFSVILGTALISSLGVSLISNGSSKDLQKDAPPVEE